MRELSQSSERKSRQILLCGHKMLLFNGIRFAYAHDQGELTDYNALA